MISERRRKRLMDKLRRVPVFDFTDIASDVPTPQVLDEMRTVLEAMSGWYKYQLDEGSLQMLAVDISMALQSDTLRRRIISEYQEAEVGL